MIFTQCYYLVSKKYFFRELFWIKLSRPGKLVFEIIEKYLERRAIAVFYKRKVFYQKPAWLYFQKKLHK